MTDYSRIEAELEEAGYTDRFPDRKAVREAVVELFYLLDARDTITGDDRVAVADLFQTLVREGELLGEERGVWQQFKLGDVKIGSTVRVKIDAYDALTGAKHNGLVGRFVEARAGRCIVSYIGRRDGVSQMHAPQNLEVLQK